jgi:hypothetical protein
MYETNINRDGVRDILKSTKPPIQWTPGALSKGVKQPGCEADHSPSFGAKVKKVELYLHSLVQGQLHLYLTEV